MGSRATIGVDIGGTKIRAALFDEKFELVSEVKAKTHAEKAIKQFKDNVKEMIGELRKTAQSKGLEIIGIGAGCAGGINRDKGIVMDSSIPFLKGFELGAFLSRHAGAPSTIGNDVHIGLYGEHRLGAALGLQHVLGIFFGTGVGGALIINGELYYGASGQAGNIGHYLVAPIGPLTGSERDGILDDFVSRSAIAGVAATLAARQKAPYLFKETGANVQDIRSGMLSDSIKNGDTTIEELVRSRARMAGVVLSNIVDLFNPEMIVLGGGLVEAMPNLLLKEVETGIRENCVPELQKTFKVAVAKLKDHAVTAGAAKMAWDSVGGEKRT